MKVLFVEPEYYSRYPPLGLLKLISYYRSWADEIKYVRGHVRDQSFIPNKIMITSLFTYAWKPVHKAIEYYHDLYPNSEIHVGGIYASILPNNIQKSYPYVKIHQGLFNKAEDFIPAYDVLNEIDKWKNWDSSIIFSSRGCIRNCPFCIVPKLEGTIRSVIDDIWSHINSDYKKIILWDNNFLANPKWRDVLFELKELGYKVDFNQGLDARLINEENASLLAELKMPQIRFAYDWLGERDAVKKAVSIMNQNGIKGRNIFIYTLFNFFDPINKIGDDPESFLTRVRDILNFGCVSYPMRYEPLNSLKKNSYISPLWTEEKLNMVAKARRVIGFGGAFPPYDALKQKFFDASGFDDAFKLRPVQTS